MKRSHRCHACLIFGLLTTWLWVIASVNTRVLSTRLVIHVDDSVDKCIMYDMSAGISNLMLKYEKPKALTLDGKIPGRTVYN